MDLEISVSFNSRSFNFDLLWLRDHCRCESCYCDWRKVNILNIPDDVSAETYKIDGEKLLVVWNDGHESSYDMSFLMKYQPEKISPNHDRFLWNKITIEDPLKTCRVAMFESMTDLTVKKKVLKNLHEFGIAMIDGVKPTQADTEAAIIKFFPMHKTFFGEVFTFSDTKTDHHDTAYTNVYLDAHNDHTYFNDSAGLLVLHCIEHSGTGGENFFIDGFHVAQQIKKNHPEVFDRLSKTIVTTEYIEEGRHHKFSAPMILLDVTGAIEQIRFNLYDRAPFTSVPAAKIRQFYSDLKLFSKEIEKPENRLTFKLQPGTMIFFDNWRLLHGRMAYTGQRSMVGSYIARTEYQSALRLNKFIE